VPKGSRRTRPFIHAFISESHTPSSTQTNSRCRGHHLYAMLFQNTKGCVDSDILVIIVAVQLKCLSRHRSSVCSWPRVPSHDVPLCFCNECLSKCVRADYRALFSSDQQPQRFLVGDQAADVHDLITATMLGPVVIMSGQVIAEKA
jgi:hypothetical protein